MSSFLRRHAGLISVAVLSLTAGLSAPAISHGVEHALFAHNSDKVDDKHAVGAGASVANRKGKLVATGSTGRLPNNIIAKAPNADKVDGIDSRQLQFPDVVPVGTTLVGRWGFDADSDGSGDWGSSISYPVPMPTSLPAEIVQFGGSSTATCPGTAAEPTATPGRLCVYVSFRTGTAANLSIFAATRFGTGLLMGDDAAAGDIYAYGTWAAQPAPPAARLVPGDAEATK